MCKNRMHVIVETAEGGGEKKEMRKERAKQETSDASREQIRKCTSG